MTGNMFTIEITEKEIYDMYILGIGPEFLPTAVRVDYMEDFVVDSFFVVSRACRCWK